MRTGQRGDRGKSGGLVGHAKAFSFPRSEKEWRGLMWFLTESLWHPL